MAELVVLLLLRGEGGGGENLLRLLVRGGAVLGEGGGGGERGLGHPRPGRTGLTRRVTTPRRTRRVRRGDGVARGRGTRRATGSTTRWIKARPRGMSRRMRMMMMTRLRLLRALLLTLAAAAEGATGLDPTVVGRGARVGTGTPRSSSLEGVGAMDASREGFGGEEEKKKAIPVGVGEGARDSTTPRSRGIMPASIDMVFGAPTTFSSVELRRRRTAAIIEMRAGGGKGQGGWGGEEGGEGACRPCPRPLLE